MKRKTDFSGLFGRLKELYPKPSTELLHGSAFELLIAVILSAQCTDKLVNKVTKEIFPVFNTPEAFAALEVSEIEKLISSVNYFRNKAKSISLMSRKLVSEFGGKVPSSLEELTSLPGIGLKSASVVRAVAFGIPALPVDTHVFRVSGRLGMIQEKTAEKAQAALMKIVPENFWIDFHHSIVLHGRYVCKARKPNCSECGISQFCEYFKKNKDDCAC